MDALERLKFLSSDMQLEPAEETGCPQPPHAGRTKHVYISKAVLPNGQRISLLKSLLTSACERNCYYCPFRAGRDMRRETFKPEEYAKTFINLYRAGLVEGSFLSSGIIGGGMRTQDHLLDTADMLRKMGYTGYLHLKIMPGAERAQVERAMQLADRLSVNLEAPNSLRLEKLAPGKQFTEELIRPLRWIEEIRRSQPGHHGWKQRWPSTVTQFVVGGAGESDVELLKTSEYLYRSLRLSRAYYSAFTPIVNTPLENHPAAHPMREHRLYQASFLLRDYGFTLEELAFDKQGDLPLQTDPKQAWAVEHLSQRPIEINRASRQELLRIPGIGPKAAAEIIRLRSSDRLSSLDALAHANIHVQRAAPFILLNGRRPDHQLSLWQVGAPA
jgi:predicted DNA-binding helix-hairpin-helix protein